MPCSRGRRCAIKLIRAPLAGSSATSGHVAAVRRRHTAPVVGPAVHPDQRAVGGSLRGGALHRRPAPAHRPVVQPGVQCGPAGGPGDLPGMAGAALRHLLRPARRRLHPGPLRPARMASRASPGSPPPSRRPSRPPWPRPSASSRWRWTSSERGYGRSQDNSPAACYTEDRGLFDLLLLLDLNQQPFD